MTILGFTWQDPLFWGYIACIALLIVHGAWVGRMIITAWKAGYLWRHLAKRRAR